MVLEVVTLLVLSKGQIHHSRGLDPIAEALQESLHDFFPRRQRPPQPSFGWPSLDGFTGGVSRGHLTVVVGESGVGKTATVLSIASSVSDEGPCLFFSLSLRPKELSDRLICQTADIPHEIYRSRLMDKSEIETLTAVVRFLAEKPIRFSGQAGSTLNDLEDAIAAMSEAGGPPATIIVDDILSVAPDGKHRSHVHKVTAHSHRLRQLAAEHDCAVIATVPLRHGVGKPTLADLQGIGMLEFDASLILLLHRPDIDDPHHEHAGTGEIIIAKNSFGPLTTLKGHHRMDRWQFIDQTYS